jgi:hypothetical protein
LSAGRHTGEQRETGQACELHDCDLALRSARFVKVSRRRRRSMLVLSSNTGKARDWRGRSVGVSERLCRVKALTRIVERKRRAIDVLDQRCPDGHGGQLDLRWALASSKSMLEQTPFGQHSVAVRFHRSISMTAPFSPRCTRASLVSDTRRSAQKKRERRPETSEAHPGSGATSFLFPGRAATSRPLPTPGPLLIRFHCALLCCGDIPFLRTDVACRLRLTEV